MLCHLITVELRPLKQVHVFLQGYQSILEFLLERKAHASYYYYYFTTIFWYSLPHMFYMDSPTYPVLRPMGYPLHGKMLCLWWRTEGVVLP